ncbi:MAG: hypothetical protein ACLRPS_05015 [Paraprevotella clara]|uniref:Uncharacterized protein n=1 Tax=Paraprevotella clara TaxID=454154 RepID=A0A6N3EXP3_9BACT
MERTYVFNQEPSSGGGNKFDIMAMLPNLMGGKGVDPNLMALLSQGRNNQDQWGGSWWFIWIIMRGCLSRGFTRIASEAVHRLCGRRCYDSAGFLHTGI